MTFYINHTDGTSLVTLQDGTIDNSTTSITLVGKNFPTYGQFVNQNFISLLENSANVTTPDNPLLGQLWYDSANKNLNFYRSGSTNNRWQKIAMTTESDSAPVDPRQGDIWYDTINKQLKIYDLSLNTWRIIGPQTTNNGRLTVSGNNSFQLIIGGNTYLTVDNIGGLNLPSNPLVWGQGVNTTVMGSGSKYTTSGINTVATWIPSSTSFIDRTSNFTPGTNISPSGRFTVKTAGYYEVYAHVSTIVGTTSGNIKLSWYKNDTGINLTAASNEYGAAAAGQYRQLVCAGTIKASFGNTIKLVYSTDIDATLGILPTNASYSIRLVQ